MGAVGPLADSIFYSLDPTDSPAFKEWFGDSKVVDKKGKPLVVYHGSVSRGVTVFDTARVTTRKDSGDTPGTYFTSDPRTAGNYTRRVGDRYDAPRGDITAAYLRIENPLNTTATIKRLVRGGMSFGEAKRKALEKLTDEHDGIIFDGNAMNAPEYVVFKPEQIKSATGNNGDYDPDNPDIRFSLDLNPFGRDALGRVKFRAGEKVYNLAAKLANVALDKVAMKPMSTGLSRRYRQMQSTVQAAQDLSVEIGEDLFKLSEDERAMVSDIIEGELAAGVTPPQNLLDIAAAITQAMGAQSDELVRLGMISQDTADRWRGRYLPRFYEPKLRKNQDPWWTAVTNVIRKPSALLGIKGKSFMGRGIFKTIDVADLDAYLNNGFEIRDDDYDAATSTEVTVWRDFTREEREGMGEIRDAAFRFLMGYNATQKDIALGRLFEHLAADVAQKTPPDDTWVKVPESLVAETTVRRYGKLAGKYVPKEVFDHISKHDDGGDLDNLLKVYRSAYAMWKEGKTALNPVSHANNIMSNVTMAHLAGVSYWDSHKYVGAIRDFVKDAPMMAEARQAGLFQGTMSREELLEIMPEQLRVLAEMEQGAAQKAADKVWNALTFWLRKPLRDAYEAEDLFFRYLIYRDARGRGLTPDDAVDYAQRFIFRYDDLPRGARVVRDVALPFFAYTYKVIPVLAHTAAVYPWRLAAPAAILHAANAVAYALAYGEDDDDWREKMRKGAEGEEAERKNLPPWLQGLSSLGTPKAIRLWTDSLTGHPVFIDVSRVFPGGDLFDVKGNAGGLPWLQNLTPSNPLFTTAVALFANRDMWFGKDLIDSNDTRGEKAEKVGSWLWRQFSPALAVGNYHWERTMQALSSATGHDIPWWPNDYTGVGRDGLPVQPRYALPQTIGIKARPYDLDASAAIEQSKDKKLVRDLKAELRQLNRLEAKGAVSGSQAESKREYINEKIRRVQQGLTVDGDEED